MKGMGSGAMARRTAKVPLPLLELGGVLLELEEALPGAEVYFPCCRPRSTEETNDS